ncbi:protein swallow-like isoform X2 [Drosophila innubila]|uniref:protein swallow-like isoform X2 n=1 Tax=Drosophila innubila TaxID=198719 RepID=UPI00148B7EEC|nr:protein swallow-like isoform X2 [Drosophila innubila]
MFKMSLQDESFPADDLFDNLNASSVGKNRSLQRQCNILQRLELSELEHFQENESPFLNSDCSEETCASDPVGLDHDHDRDPGEAKNGAGNNDGITTTIARSSKAISYQDIHTAYTRRRYQHVTSKVRKYIAEMDDPKQKRCQNASGAFQRHRSMPESLTPRGNAEDQQKLDESLSTANSSETNTNSNSRDESYERLLSEKDWRIDHLESKLFKKFEENIQLRKNFEAARNYFEAARKDLTECQEKLKRQAAGGNGALGHSLHSLMYYPTLPHPSERERVAKATQTDLAHMLHLSDLSDMPAIAANATPHPNANLNDITYDSRDGSIEIPLLSVRPEPNKSTKMSGHLQPLLLNFSNDCSEVDANGNALNKAGGDAGINSQPSSCNRIVTNNSGSSHPSSNDSAIDIEGHELRSPQPRFRGQTINFVPVGDIIYIDKHNNRVIELVSLNPATRIGNSNADSSNNTSTQSQSFDYMQYTSNNHTNRRKRSLASRMLRIFGPCARCDDPNQTLDATNATYTVAVPLLGNDSDRV